MKNSGDQNINQCKMAVLYTQPVSFCSLLSYGYKVCIRSLIMHLWANLIIILNLNILNFTQQVALW